MCSDGRQGDRNKTGREDTSTARVARSQVRGRLSNFFCLPCFGVAPGRGRCGLWLAAHPGRQALRPSKFTCTLPAGAETSSQTHNEQRLSTSINLTCLTRSGLYCIFVPRTSIVVCVNNISTSILRQFPKPSSNANLVLPFPPGHHFPHTFHYPSSLLGHVKLAIES